MNEAELRINQAKRKKTVKWLIAAGVFFVVLGGGIFWLVRSRPTGPEEKPGVFYKEVGAKHITPGTKGVGYSSNPPASGEHYPSPAEWGIYDKELPDEVLVHNLEHGGIWISYKPGISGDSKVKLEDFYRKFGRKVIVAPREANDADIVLAAWEYLDKFSVAEYSEERIEKFIKAYRNKGPEFVP